MTLAVEPHLPTIVYILTGLVTFLISALFVVFNVFSSRFNTFIKELVLKVDKISDGLEKHNGQLIEILTRDKFRSEKMDTMQNEIQDHDVRLRDHEKQLSDIKVNCAKNKHLK